MNSRSLPISIREITFTALMGAMLFVAQVALAVLPNIEVVSLLILLYASVFPLRRTLAACYLFALLEGMIYGFGIWWVMYLYVWPLLAVLAHLLRRNGSPLAWAVLSGAFGLGFGALCAIPYMVAGGALFGLNWWISGIPFDIAHCLGNVAAVLVLYRPLRRFFERMEGILRRT